MDEKKRLPSEILAILEEKGLFEKDILLTLKSDMDTEYHYTDVYCVVTGDAFAVLSGNMAMAPCEKRWGAKKPQLYFREYGYQEYDRKELSGFDITKDITSGLLTADYEGEHITLARFSMAVQNSAYTFLDNLTRLCEKAKELNIPLEYNMLGKYYGRNYPNKTFWNIAKKVGNTAVIGFDAHTPTFMLKTDLRDECVNELNELGIKLLDFDEINIIKP